MEMYDKNLKTLAKYYPKLDELIEKARENMKKKLEIYEEWSNNGERILKIEKDRRICYLNGKRNAVDAAEKWVGSIGMLQENAPILIEGIGNETYLLELISKVEKKLVIVVYEPSLQIFIDFLEHVDLERIFQCSTCIFVIEEVEGMGKEFLKTVVKRLLNYAILPFSRTFITPNYDTLFPQETLDFIRVCHEVVSGDYVNFNTMRRFESVFVKNLFINMTYFCKCYKTTQLPTVIPRDIPGIVVAAGPSLNKNVQQLKKAKGKAFIIATDTAVKPLLKAGIIPDMFNIVDAKKPLHLVKMEEARNIPLLTTMDGSSEILNYHTGMKFFANEGLKMADRMFFRCDKQFGIASEGGSVATAAFTLLYKIGIETVILVGQDLAFTDNRSHADGTFQDKMPVEDTKNYPMVEGNNGEKVPTRGDFLLYLDWYNKFIAGCQKNDPSFRVINATEGGAKIKNTEVMTLKEAIEKECKKEVDIQECLNKLSPIFNGADREWVIHELISIAEKCKKLSLEAMKTVKLYRRLDSICDKRVIDVKSYKSLLKRLKKQISKIENDEIYQLVVITLNTANYIIKNEQFIEYDSVREEGKEIARKGILYMDTVSECALLYENYAKEVFLEKSLREI